MRRLLKFLHTMGAIGFMGALACLVALSRPAAAGPTRLLRADPGRDGGAATWVILPSFALTLVPGLLSIAVTPAFHNAGWAWIKAATGI